MTESIRKYVYRLLILVLILSCVSYGLFNFLFPEYYFKLFPLLPVFLFTVTIIVHLYLVRASKGDTRKFTSKYLGAMGLKIFIYLAFIIVILFIDTASAIPFIVSFLVMYATLTTFEVIFILNTLKKRP